MIKLPQNTKQLIVTNGKNAYQGVISYTKNIDFDEEGVIKLAAPLVSIFSTEAANGGDANLALPVDIYGYNSTDFLVITRDRSFGFSLDDISFDKLLSVTDFRDGSRVVSWVSNLWFVNAGAVYSHNGTAYTSRIAVVLDYIELFTNKNTLVGVPSSAKNTVAQYNSSYSLVNTLTIPANFEVTGLAYSDNKMGVVTRQLNNEGNAYFFVWDGSGTEATQGIPVNDSYIVSIAAYKSSWVILTSQGQLLYFNGGGFTELATLPVYNFGQQLESLTPGETITLGKNIQVEGDLIYINCASLPEFSIDSQAYNPFFSGGVYCYDPKVGLYHKYAPSYSRYLKETGTSSSNVITLGTHFINTGDEIWIDSDDQGLTGGRMYYAIYVSPTTIQLADTYIDAIAGTALTITDGSINIWYVRRKDYGIESIRLTDAGVVKKSTNYSGYSTSALVPFFVGASLRPNDVNSTRTNVLNVIAPNVSNRGYFVTGKFQTDSVDEIWQMVAVKYRKLKPQNSIIVKAKTKDVEPIVLGTTALYNSAAYTGEGATWTTSTSFYTTGDLSSVERGDEVHIFDGCGAGQSVHISQIQQSDTGYIVEVDEAIRGFVANARSGVSIDKWKKIGTITANNPFGVATMNVGANSGTLEIKGELRGVGTTVTEIQVISTKGRQY